MTEKNNYSIDAVIKFLEQARDTKALKFNTARTRITALKKLKGYLDSDERKDLRQVDLIELGKKLREQGNVNEGTVQTYLTRLQKSIESYQKIDLLIDSQLSSKSAVVEQKLESIKKETLVVAVDGTIVRITNLPIDLSTDQAEKICMALKGFAEDNDIRDI